MTATVLVVDDLDANVKLLEAKLLSEYYTVITANSGEAAIDALLEHKIDIVLLDVMMPGMDGFETCKKIKSTPATTHIPVVMVTALSDIEDRIKGLEAGADEFLTKPINDIALFARVKSLTRMKKVSDELKLRNNTTLKLGGNILKPKENFTDSKILLFDDDEIQVKNITNSLKDLTLQVKALPSPDDIDKLVLFVPDIIIISCQINMEDPLRISAMLRSKPIFKNAILMLLAEEENMHMVIKGMELGINDYFIYPVDKSELQARIKTQLRRKLYQDNLRIHLEESVDLSTKDGLTGIFNRRYFDIHIKQLLEKANESNKKICLMMVDVDHFKHINDHYGHLGGDDVLRKMSKILSGLFRVTDLVSRYGGEEFSVLLSDVAMHDCLIIAEKTRLKIQATSFSISGQENPIKITVSIGVAEYSPGQSVEDFITKADRALYKAKDTGRNRVVAG